MEPVSPTRHRSRHTRRHLSIHILPLRLMTSSQIPNNAIDLNIYRSQETSIGLKDKVREAVDFRAEAVGARLLPQLSIRLQFRILVSRPRNQ